MTCPKYEAYDSSNQKQSKESDVQHRLKQRGSGYTLVNNVADQQDGRDDESGHQQAHAEDMSILLTKLCICYPLYHYRHQQQACFNNLAESRYCPNITRIECQWHLNRHQETRYTRCVWETCDVW